MGVDLEVMASYFREGTTMIPTATIRFERDPNLFALLEKLGRPMTNLKVGRFEDEGLRYREQDSYGQPLTFLHPTDIGLELITLDTFQWNKAALSFLRGLPADKRIILYWC